MNTIDWIKNNTKKESKMVSVLAAWVALLAERRCVSFPWVPDQAVILEFLEAVGAEYLIVSPGHHNEQRFLIPVINDNLAVFLKIFQTGAANVYEINQTELKKRLPESHQQLDATTLHDFSDPRAVLTYL